MPTNAPRNKTPSDPNGMDVVTTQPTPESARDEVAEAEAGGWIDGTMS